MSKIRETTHRLSRITHGDILLIQLVWFNGLNIRRTDADRVGTLGGFPFLWKCQRTVRMKQAG
jgi:hypothetical protein